MSEMTHTPEQMLDLARAVMPEICSGEVKISFWENGGVIGIYCPFTPIANGHFDPLGNPAHAWAAFKFLFMNSQNGECERIADEVFSSVIEKTGNLEQANLAAAVAVMGRMKEMEKGDKE